MSLEIAAKHLASKGRGPDTQLVHMTLGELNSLQELAKAHAKKTKASNVLEGKEKPRGSKNTL
jgi:hypothetical protein